MQEKIKITLVLLGYTSSQVDIDIVKKWKSKLFQIADIHYIKLLPDSNSPSFTLAPCYSKEQLSNILRRDNNSDMTVGLINYEIEENYYLRILDSNMAVISIYEIDDIVKWASLDIETFIIRCLYELAIIYKYFGNELNSDAYTLAHQETRGCLFDLCGNKMDIIYSLEKLTICDECQTRLKSSQLPEHIYKNLDQEIKKIKKPLYLRIVSYVKRKPIRSFIITALFTVLINVFSNFLFSQAQNIIQHNRNKASFTEKENIDNINGVIDLKQNDNQTQ